MSDTETKPKLKRFRLLRGGHFDPNAYLISEDGKTKTPMGVGDGGRKPNPEINGGRGFEPDDVIETDKDLFAMFGGKFEELEN